MNTKYCFWYLLGEIKIDLTLKKKINYPLFLFTAVECSLDKVTTEEPISGKTSSQQPETTSHEPMSSMHTGMTSSPTMPPSPRRHFEVKNGDIICLVLDGSFTFTIPYTKKDNTESIF